MLPWHLIDVLNCGNLEKAQKMVTTVRKLYYWSVMKQGISQCIAKCLECQHVKFEHIHPTGLLQPFHIPEWKWEIISMYFIIEFPKTIKKHDAIMVVVDKLSKEAHFIPIKCTFKATDIANIFSKEIFRLHGLPKTIISDLDAKFTSNLWKLLFACLEM
jgi:hypothetical protein